MMLRHTARQIRPYVSRIYLFERRTFTQYSPPHRPAPSPTFAASPTSTLAPGYDMAFSRQSLMTKGKRPFTAASRVLHASSTTASRVFNATAPTFATRAFARASNKTSSLIQRGLSRAYSTGKNGPEFNGGQTTGAEVPLYRACQNLLTFFNSDMRSSGKLIKAWTETPTKWYPIPIAVGAILLVVIQYRKNSRKRNPEVIVDEDGVEVVKLKGPWQVCALHLAYRGRLQSPPYITCIAPDLSRPLYHRESSHDLPFQPLQHCEHAV